MRKIVIILSLVGSSVVGVHAQTTPLILQEMSSDAETAYKAGEYDKALALGEMYLSKALSFFYQHEEHAMAYHFVGKVYLVKREYSRAVSHFIESLHVRETSGKMNDAHKTYNNLGVVFYQWGSYENALEYYTKAYEAKRWQEVSVRNVLRNLGLTYQAMNNTTKALEHYAASYKIAMGEGNSKFMSKLYNDIALCHKQSESYDSAIYYLQRSNKLGEAFTEPVALRASKATLNIGEIYHRQERYIESLTVYQDALAIKGATDNGKIEYNVGLNYFKLGEYEKAIPYFHASEKVANSDLLVSVYSSLNQAYKGEGHGDLAMQYQAKQADIQIKLSKDKEEAERLATKLRQEINEVKADLVSQYTLKAERQELQANVCCFILLLAIAGIIGADSIRKRRLTYS